MIFEWKGKLGVIDNHDPVGVNEELYKKSDFYFATNKLLKSESYNQPKVKPIFPHYPINIISKKMKFIGLRWLKSLSLRDFAREIYILKKRPVYQLQKPEFKFGNYVFFSGSTWKKEPWANQIRAEFIRVCKNHPQIEFEGGFIPRSDGNNFGYDQELNLKRYSPTEFSKLSSRSLINLNNPAVLGAVSWRLAEYWNAGTFVVSFPFEIDLPIFPKQGEEIHYVENSSEYQEVLNLVLRDKAYHEKIARGGHSYFQKYCTPDKQWEYIASFFE
ncbi:glycosyltransferase [Algoriphagus limi]|uniref:Glycosyltransferase n=1 Tax=Algoriphagus limi TaxID=2975273 RepID=A0ABT2G160_9BACT|nr:glycosyltransferase [Algoriphagus limi]MCS5488998.1 glycosyltransferase [Algoriphagus limi]